MLSQIKTLTFLGLWTILINTNLINCSSLKYGADLFVQLSEKVNSYQVLKEQEYAPPFKWYEKLGLYRSDIRLNFFGNLLAQELRSGEVTAIFDNDMFSTGWIITALLETTLYGKGVPALEHKRLKLALEAIGAYHNKNDKNFQSSIIRTFWPQIYNSTYDLWQQQPVNIRNVALNIEKIPFGPIEAVLKTLKLDTLIKYLEEFKQLGSESIKAFCIPPDFDDTYLNLGIGATLFKLRSLYPDLYENWSVNNTDVDHLIEVTTKYAYRPFDTDLNKNVIDPRTYFFARGFIQEAKSENKTVSLITTWIQNIDEQRKLKSESVSMPFNLNNVDVTVSANSVYGMTSAAIYNVNNFAAKFLENQDLIQVYLNTTKFIAWSIKSNFSSRPDLAQVYYPSTYNFLWYASRTLFLIENEIQKFSYMVQNRQYESYFKYFAQLQDVLLEAKSYLQDAFENSATKYLFNWAIKESNGHVYYRDFIGLNDTNIFGKPESNNNDALFSTAQAINILISTWTYQNPETGSLIWKPNTPVNVKELIKSSVLWLEENILGKKYKALNAFFSGSVKGFTSLPFWYPANFVQFINGTYVNPSEASRDELTNIIYGVQGSIDEPTYQSLLKQTHFGVSTPLDFEGYNVKENIFPFWSSQPYTYAVALLALSQYNNIDNI